MAKVGLNLGLNRCLQTTKNHKIKKRVSKKYLAPSIYSYPYWRLKSNIRFYKGVFCLFGHPLIQRAENGTQTRDPQLGRLVLYRLSYFRKCIVPHTQAGLTMLFRSVMGKA